MTEDGHAERLARGGGDAWGATATRVDELTLLQRITAIANEALTLDRALDRALPVICEAFDFALGHAFVPTGDPARPLRASGHWWTPGLATYPEFRAATESESWDVVRGMPGRVMESRSTEWVLDVHGDPDFLRVDAGSDSKIRAGVGVPLLSGDRSIGVLEFYVVRELSPNREVQRLLEQIGVQLGRVWERQVSARELAESRGRLRQLAENMDAAFWMASTEGAILYVSPAYERLLGLDSGRGEEGRTGPVVGGTVSGLLAWVHPEDRPRLRALLEAPDRAPYEVEFRVQRADGRVAWLRQRAFPLRDTDGVVRRVGGLTEDVTDRRESWARLEDTTRLLQQTIASLEEGVLVIDTSGGGRGILDVNPAAEAILGWGRDELIGGTTEKLHVDTDHFHRFHVEHLEGLLRDGVVHASYPLRRKDGTVFEAEQTVKLLDPGRGLLGGAVSVIRDVSHRRELERRLRQSHKMEAIGRLAGGVAHDFNNLLTVIRAHSDFLRLELPPGAGMGPEIDAIQEAADRAARLTAQLLALGREQVLRPRVVDLNAIVRRVERLIQRVLGEDIRIQTDLDDGPLPLLVDPGQLEQVIMNLVVNARDAMPDGGVLDLVTRHGADPGEWPGAPEDREAVCLYVRDTGIGMDEATRARIFEPFYTTKEGTGTGLGLASAYGIVTQSGGSIDVKSVPGEGATFGLHFPRARGEPEPLDAPVGARAVPTRLAATLLVVEDEESVLRVVRRVLEKEGARVLTATDGETALALLDRHPGAVDLLLTDLVLPGMGGRELVERLKARATGARIVVMSGYDESPDGRAGELPADVRFLPKPFTPAQLREVVAEALAD